MSADHEALVALGGRLLVDAGSARAYAIDGQPRVYVVAAHERLTRADLAAALTVVYDHAGEFGPTRLLFWETSTSKGFDRDVLDFYKEDQFKHVPTPDEVAVVSNSRMINVVVSATGIGFRLFTKRSLRTYASIAEAVMGVTGA